MVRNIRLDEIIVARSDAAAAEPLPSGLARKLYTEPLILRADMVLVDGLRRLLWHREQGHETAPIVVVSTFEEAIEALAPQHENRHSTLVPIRIWNMYSILRGYSQAYAREQRSIGWEMGPDGKKVRPPHKKPARESRVRTKYLAALKVPGHQLQSSAYMYRMAEQGDSYAKQLIDRVETGEFSIAFANKLYRNPNRLTGNVTNRSEQKRILERGVIELQAHMSALQKLGHPIQVSDEDLDEAIGGLTSTRSELSALIGSLRKTAKERESDG